MSEKTEIKQIASVGSKGTQIGTQNVQVGLSPEDAMNMALKIFREYYPQLKSDVLEEIEEVLPEILSRTPHEQISSPSPRIAVPAIQNACITPEKEIRELYEELLANSMKESIKDGVHPGFVEIIKQLCPDEAKVLRYMKFHEIIPTVYLRYENDKGEGVDYISCFSNVGEITNCEYPYSIAEYFDNLCRLGLLNNKGELSSLTNKSLYEGLKTHKYIIQKSNNKRLIEAGFTNVRVKESYVELTDYGKSFCEICIPKLKMVVTLADGSQQVIYQ